MGGIGRFLRRVFLVGTIIGGGAAVITLLRNPLRRDQAKSAAATAWRTGREATSKAATTVRGARGAPETGESTGPPEGETEPGE